METLQELKNKYKKLQKESNKLRSKIKTLEKKDVVSKIAVGDCYLDLTWNYLMKIISIENNYAYYICLGKNSISRENFYIFDIENWKKITSKQFKNVYLAILKDIQDPDLNNKKESNYNIVLNSIISSFNKEKNNLCWENILL